MKKKPLWPDDKKNHFTCWVT